MKIIIIPDSFKGTMTAAQVADIVETAAKRHFPHCETVKIPVADGGEGTLEALCSAMDLTLVPLSVCGPLGQPVDAVYGVCGDTAVIELAKTSGICLIDDLSARRTTTYGLGEAMRHALEGGAAHLYIGIGGSATNDGGTGLLTALGVRLLDAHGNALAGIGENLGNIHAIDMDGLLPQARNAVFTAICDVQNPPVGKQGATYVYGPQKGATPADLDFLEHGMRNWCAVLERTFGKPFSEIPGGGAAGGVGLALQAFFGAKLMPGIDTVLETVGFDALVRDADLVITGEGRIDGQSVYGKVPVGVAAHSGGKPVLAIVGAVGDGFEAVYARGVTSVFSTYNTAMELPYALQNAVPLLEQAADRMLRIVKAGIEIGRSEEK